MALDLNLLAFINAVGADIKALLSASPNAASGTGEIDFGAFPGNAHATLTITGQAGIVAGSVCEAWIVAKDTVDHSADEHVIDPPRLIAGAIVPGDGFVIHGLSRDPVRAAAERARGQIPVSSNPSLPFGRWSIAWRWK